MQPGDQNKKAGESDKGLFENFFKKSSYVEKKLRSCQI
jgi:hypothetical protein